MNENIEIKDFPIYKEPHPGESGSRLQSQLAAINQLSQEFSQAVSEKEILQQLLQAVLRHTQALSASYIPADDNSQPLAFIRKGQALKNSVFENWAAYLSAPPIRSQCKICRKEHPVSAVCPLLSNPISDATTVFCLHLKVGTQKIGVVNLYLHSETEIDSETQCFLSTIANTAALAISSLQGRLNLRSLQARLDQDDLLPLEETDRLTAIQQRAILDERSRLAREIHDGLAQILGYVKLQLSQSIEYLQGGEIDRLGELIQSSNQAISDAYIDAREAIDDLHHVPSSSDFVSWLDETLEEFHENFNIQGELHGWPGKLVLPDHIHVHLRRMIQEILSNVRKHAQASLVQLTYRRDDRYTILEICDDGVGLPNQDIAERSHHGLQSLRERARLIEAKLEFSSQPGQGTTIRIQLPNEVFAYSP